MKLKVKAADIIKGKFANTIGTIGGFYSEAHGDLQNGTNYSANAVFKRMDKIREVFQEDLKNLIDEIEIGEEQKNAIIQNEESPQPEEEKRFGTKITHNV